MGGALVIYRSILLEEQMEQNLELDSPGPGSAPKGLSQMVSILVFCFPFSSKFLGAGVMQRKSEQGWLPYSQLLIDNASGIGLSQPQRQENIVTNVYRNQPSPLHWKSLPRSFTSPNSEYSIYTGLKLGFWSHHLDSNTDFTTLELVDLYPLSLSCLIVKMRINDSSHLVGLL